MQTWRKKIENKIVCVFHKYFFKNSSGIELCGILSCPKTGKSGSVIILCHGFTTSKDGRTNIQLEKILNDGGLATFRFDFFGHGESGGTFENITISEAVDDVLQAFDFVKSTGFKRVGLIGSSFGGIASILAASQTDNLSVLALKSPVSDYMEILKRHNHGGKNLDDWRRKGVIFFKGATNLHLQLKYAFVEDAQKVDVTSATRKITIPTLIVHGARDETVPVTQSFKVSRFFKNCRLEILKNADHVYSQPRDFDKMIRLISDYIMGHFQIQE